MKILDACVLPNLLEVQILGDAVEASRGGSPTPITKAERVQTDQENKVAIHIDNHRERSDVCQHGEETV